MNPAGSPVSLTVPPCLFRLPAHGWVSGPVGYAAGANSLPLGYDPEESGADGRTRTVFLLDTNEVFCQLNFIGVGRWGSDSSERSPVGCARTDPPTGFGKWSGAAPCRDAFGGTHPRVVGPPGVAPESPPYQSGDS